MRLPTPIQQTTLRRSVTLEGTGVHGNRPSRVTLHPADEGCGIAFCRVDGPADVLIPASWTHVVSSTLATTLAHPDHPRAVVRGVEHLLAALAGLRVDNALIEVEEDELPILDGSARPFVTAVGAAGLRRQARMRRVIEILKPVRVEAGAAFAQFRPSSRAGLALDISIDYPDAAVGYQRHATTLSARTFGTLARARTFGFTADAERLWREGFALGSSLENTIVVSEGRVLNPGGLRMPDEFVRHKMLDAIGDLVLAGAPLQGAFRSHRGGHALNVAALRALLADMTAWRFVRGSGAGRGERRPAESLPHSSVA